MASPIKGPGLFLAQFAGDEAPFNNLPDITQWAAGLGYRGVQIPTFDDRLFNLDLAAQSDDYCQEVAGICAEAGVEITELSTHLQGQLVAVNPAYDDSFDAFAPEAVHGKPAARTEWAIDQVKKAAVASRRLGLSHTVSFTGSLAFPFLYPLPSLPDAGCRCLIIIATTALISVLKFTRVRMCLTGPLSRCLSMPAAAMNAR
jgi:sugar phosphate isomerase/epimerase